MGIKEWIFLNKVTTYCILETKKREHFCELKYFKKKECLTF